MVYINTKDMLIKARKEKFVVGAFNIVNHTSMVSVAEAAIEERSPVIIQTSQKTVEALGYKMLVDMAKDLAQGTDVPISMNLDHGTDMDIIENCIEHGWSSIMVDGSSLPYQENIEMTKKVVEMAHQKGITVEGELGHIGGTEEQVSVDQEHVMLTDPQMAVDFQQKTGIDSLAVAIGTAHGLYSGEPRLDYQRLAKIMEVTDFPIVIHGCSGLSQEVLAKIRTFGVSKMNISTEIKHKYIDSCDLYIKEHPHEYEPVKKINFVKEEVKKLVKKYIGIFGSAGKA
ncbi:MAG: class II fructose-bisphosphate aldolase [Actinomycetota bacterium]|nr:class II fructose-bisphosphate aldolase [Actinomycetota bacterium]